MDHIFIIPYFLNLNNKNNTQNQIVPYLHKLASEIPKVSRCPVTNAQFVSKIPKHRDQREVLWRIKMVDNIFSMKNEKRRGVEIS